MKGISSYREEIVLMKLLYVSIDEKRKKIALVNRAIKVRVMMRQLA